MHLIIIISLKPMNVKKVNSSLSLSVLSVCSVVVVQQ